MELTKLLAGFDDSWLAVAFAVVVALALGLLVHVIAFGVLRRIGRFSVLVGTLAKELDRPARAVLPVPQFETYPAIAIEAETYDIALLDLGLPKSDGRDVLKRLRNSGRELPVIIVTARDAVDDRCRVSLVGVRLVDGDEDFDVVARHDLPARRGFGRDWQSDDAQERAS